MKGSKGKFWVLLYKIMRSCMTRSLEESMPVYELHIYVATALEELYRVAERELPKSAVYRTKGSQKDFIEGRSGS